MHWLASVFFFLFFFFLLISIAVRLAWDAQLHSLLYICNIYVCIYDIGPNTISVHVLCICISPSNVFT